MAPLLRQATRADVDGIFSVRYAVTENRLQPGKIDAEDVRREIEDSGRGWVVEVDGQIVGFAIGNLRSGNIWALFVLPGHQGQGHGQRLHDTMIAWLWSQGLTQLWLSTGIGSRAEAFYARNHWLADGPYSATDNRWRLTRS
jgi:GNAT superfamily N-acetyltransferase